MYIAFIISINYTIREFDSQIKDRPDSVIAYSDSYRSGAKMSKVIVTACKKRNKTNTNTLVAMPHITAVTSFNRLLLL